MAQAGGQIAAGDDQVPPVIVLAADNDVAVGRAGVEGIDCPPVQLCAEIVPHLPHQPAGEGAQVLQSGGILRGDSAPTAMISGAVRFRSTPPAKGRPGPFMTTRHP